MEPLPVLRGKQRLHVSRRTAYAAAAAIVALMACSPTDESVRDERALQEVVADQQEHLDTLEERFAQLEQALSPLTDGATAVEELGSISTQVSALQARIDELSAAVDDERDARLAFVIQLDDSQTDLRETLAELRDHLLELRALIDDLEIRYTILQQRIDQLQR